MPKKLKQVTFYIEPEHREPLKKLVQTFQKKMAEKTGTPESNFNLSQLLRLWIEKGAEDFISQL